MSFGTLILIAFGLSMDAFAVSVSRGIPIKKNRLKNAVTIAAFFGAFQAFMPLVGFGLGFGLRQFIDSFDHWIAFLMLAVVGLKMIYEGLRAKPDTVKEHKIGLHTLLILSVATSLDALAVGIGLPFIKVNLLLAVILIGVITFINSFVGFYMGNKIGEVCSKRVEIFGGTLLIAIGLKILISG